MIKHILITLFCITTICSAYGQRGNEFWFAVPKITTGDGGADGKVRFVFTSYDKTTTINIAQVQVEGFTPINITHTLPPNSSWEWNAGDYMGQLEVMANYPQPYALHMTADADFSVYFANVTNNSEIYTLKGSNALGTYFIVPMQYEYNSGNYASGYNSIQILATEDDTQIEVELFKRTTNPLQTADHQTITINLDKGFCYAFHSLLEDNSPGIDHLYNTRIRSNKPIAVNTTDDSVQPGDLVGDQIVPVSLCGTSYIAVKNAGNIEKVYIFPTEDNTVVSIDGIAQPVMNLNGNNKMVISLTSPATYISSNKKIMAWQISSATGTNELGGAMLPKLECTGSMEASYRRVSRSTEIYFNIITHTENTDAFTVNGESGIITASDFSTVPGHPEWSYCRKRMDAYSKPTGIRLKNSKGYFHAATYDNLGSSCTFGYFSDFHDIRLNVVSDLPNYTPGDVIHLFMTNASAFTDIQWTKPDGTVIYEDEIIIPSPTFTDAGIYVVRATSKDGCTIKEDGVVVVNFVESSHSSISICQGDSVELTADGYAPYNWFPSSETEPAIHVQPADTTIYWVNNGKIAENIVFNGDFQNNNTMFQSDYVYGGTGNTAVATTNRYSVWRNAKEVNPAYNRINDHTTNSSTKGRFLVANCSDEPKAKIWTRRVDVIPNTQYEFAAWFVGALRGGSKAKLRFSINNKPVGNVIEMTDPGTTPTTTVWKQSSCTWMNTTGVTAEISIEVAEDSPNGAGVCIDDITFRPLLAITDTFTVNVVPKPNPVITGDTILCQGKAVLDAGTFTNSNPFESYSWYTEASATPIATTQVLSVNASGKYFVEVFNDICNGLDSFNVAPGNELNILLDSTVQICPEEPNFSLNYELVDGELASYSILFDPQAKAAGFEDLQDQSVSGNQLIIDLPANIRSGIYNAKIELLSRSVCGDSRTIPLQILVKRNAEELMTQKWNDVISLFNEDYNGGYYYTSYQWYKNGLLLEGETKSYIYLGNGVELDPNDRYSVMLTTVDGESFLTCDFIPEIRNNVISLPTLVSASETISLKNMSVSGIATFREISGAIYSRQLIDKNNLQLQVPAKKGLYILDVIINDENVAIKMVVH